MVLASGSRPLPGPAGNPDLQAPVVELRVEVRPPSPFRLPRMLGRDGVTRRRGGVVERLLHDPEGEPVAVRVAQTAPDTVLFGARAPSRPAAEHGIARMRFALGVDDDLSAFRARFADDPLIGRSVRTRPWLRARRRPEPFEALLWAICEQLIEYERAAAIQRRLARRLGRTWSGEHADAWADGLFDSPTPAKLAGTAPALFESYDLSAARATALRRVAREVASGRLDLGCCDRPEPSWRRLLAIPGIGAWTIEILALHGQGRYDQLPAGDLGLLKLVGRLRSGGDPRARATEEQVRELFASYGDWAGLAAVHAAGL
ncbi:MAG TPA: hypothetical protein VMG80_00310 [Solirubrobacteraceae bacterium]|nr:hypothetical protein [Solirubrobacteraceae bacterium]